MIGLCCSMSFPTSDHFRARPSFIIPFQFNNNQNI